MPTKPKQRINRWFFGGYLKADPYRELVAKLKKLEGARTDVALVELLVLESAQKHGLLKEVADRLKDDLDFNDARSIRALMAAREKM